MDNESVFIVPTPGNDGKVWYDGYAGEDVILFDDFYGWLKWTEILRMTDRYSVWLRVKGGYVPSTAKKVIFTSNTHPDEWYHYDNKMRKGAFQRRVTKVLKYQLDLNFGVLTTVMNWQEQ